MAAFDRLNSPGIDSSSSTVVAVDDEFVAEHRRDVCAGLAKPHVQCQDVTDVTDGERALGTRQRVGEPRRRHVAPDDVFAPHLGRVDDERIVRVRDDDDFVVVVRLECLAPPLGEVANFIGSVHLIAREVQQDDDVRPRRRQRVGEPRLVDFQGDVLAVDSTSAAT